MREFSIIVFLALASCTGPIDASSTREKPTGYLCRLLGPDYITSPAEQEAIYRELERRNMSCVSTQRIILG